MRDHTTPRFHELVATAGGKAPTITPGPAEQTAIFQMQGLPAGDKMKFWYYVQSICVLLSITLDQAASGGAVVNADKLWKLMASFSVQSPILGELFAHRNTRGSTLGNIIMPFARNFTVFPSRAQVAATDGDTVVELLYRLPFAYEVLIKPHETSPWAGFLEGGTVECRVNIATALDGDSTGLVSKATTSLRAWMELTPSPEPIIHAPTLWRDFTLPGATTRHLFTQMGSADGLQGIDTREGIGLAALLYLTDATGMGLGGADGVDNILSYDIPFRSQGRIDAVQAPIESFLNGVGKNPGQRAGIGAGLAPNDRGGWPYTMAAAPAVLNDAQMLFYPMVAPGRDLETSKLQTVRGDQEINIGYTATPAGSARFLTWNFYRFTEAFEEGLRDLLLGGKVDGALIAPKTVRKNDASTVNESNPKLAYTRRKVYLPQKRG